jgi:hypothetical protein
MPLIQTLKKQVRDRAERIRSARLTVPHVPIPFAELQEPCYTLNTDADLESFLRRNNLTYALDEYIRAEQVRAIPSNEN